MLVLASLEEEDKDLEREKMAMVLIGSPSGVSLCFNDPDSW